MTHPVARWITDLRPENEKPPKQNVLMNGRHSYIFLDQLGRPSDPENVKFILEQLVQFEIDYDSHITGWRIEAKNQDAMSISEPLICGLWVDHQPNG